MSKYKKKAEQIVSDGEDRRGDFTPHGVTKKVYSFWLNNTNTKHGTLVREGLRKENFCHFWRVVAIWAPLMFLRLKLESAADGVMDFLDRVTGNNAIMAIISMIAIAIFIGTAIYDAEILLNGFLILLSSVAVVFVLGLVVINLTEGNAVGVKSPREPDLAGTVKYSVVPFGLFFALGFLIGRFALFVERLYRFSEARGKTNWFWRGTISLIALVAGVLTYTIAGASTALMVLGSGLGAILLIVGFITLMSYLGDKIEAKRHDRERKHRLEEDERVASFVKWLFDNYEGAFIAEHGRTPYGFWELNSYYELNFKNKEIAEPTKIENFFVSIGAFFVGIGDFLVLIAQIVRVNKWKICPTVSISSEVDTKASV